MFLNLVVGDLEDVQDFDCWSDRRRSTYFSTCLMTITKWNPTTKRFMSMDILYNVFSYHHHQHLAGALYNILFDIFYRKVSRFPAICPAPGTSMHQVSLIALFPSPWLSSPASSSRSHAFHCYSNRNCDI